MLRKIQKATPSVSLAIFFFAFVLVMVGNAVGSESAEVLTVTAIAEDEEVLVGDPNADEGMTRGQSHFPENPELFIPMPIPEPTEPVIVTQPESRLVSYNMITGEETISEITYKDFPMATWVKGGMAARAESLPWEIEEEQVQPRNFSDLSLISNPEDYPWCVNVKLYMTFPGPSYYVASGVLIDPLHVLTAGHCVHEGSGGSWATSIVVVPGYENGVRPYGDASSVQLHTWTGWAQDGNWDHDMAIIDLDRPIGALTGWHGYGYNNDCSFFTNFGNTFWNPGYPAESPYNGQYLYWWYGYFDECATYQVKFYKRSYRGQSGSGAYYTHSGPNRVVYAELSNGTSTWTRDVRITSTKFGHIKDSFIADDTPSTFDLIPLDVNIAPASITAGNQLSSMNYLVHNYSSASWSGTVNINVYLSTNDNISTADTLIQSHSFTSSFSPKSSVQVNVLTPPTIPLDIPEGNYWIGVILNISDYNTGNNDSDGQDASPVAIECPTPSTPSNPNPSDGATGVSINADLDWSNCTNTDSYDVYFGTSSSPPYYGNTSSSNYNLPTLNYSTHYYWKIVAKNDCGNSAPGSVWDFTTEPVTEGPTLTLGTEKGRPDSTVNVPGYLYENSTVVGCQFDVVFNSNNLESGGSAQPGADLEGTDFSVASSVIEPGKIRIIITPPSVLPVPIIPNGEIVILPFHIKADAPEVCEPLNFENVIASDEYGYSVPLTTSPGEICITQIQPGDANGDGDINVLDVICIINCILDPTFNPEGNPDCNEDGTVNVQDVICVINKILGG